MSFVWSGWDSTPPPIDWAVKDYFARSSVYIVFAKGGSLKTWFVMDAAMAVATGRPWLGHIPVSQGRSLIVDYESGKNEARRRAHVLGGKGKGLDYKMAYAWGPTLGWLEDPETWGKLEEPHPDFLMIDSLAAGSPSVDENSKGGALPLHHAGNFAERTGCCVVFIHHANKGSTGDDRDGIRGSGAIMAAVDGAYKTCNIDDTGNAARLWSVKNGLGPKPKMVEARIHDYRGLILETPDGESSFDD